MSAITLPEPFGRDGLRLRPVGGDDVPAIVAACRDAEIQRWTRVPSPYGDDDGREFVRLSHDSLASGSGAHLVVVGEDRGELLGAVGLDVERRDLTGEIGYWVAPEARRRGVAVSGSRFLCELAFGDLGLRRLSLLAAVDNPGSNAVARRLGFRVEGVLRSACVIGPSGDPDAPRGDMHLYGLLPGELT